MFCVAMLLSSLCAFHDLLTAVSVVVSPHFGTGAKVSVITRKCNTHRRGLRKALRILKYQRRKCARAFPGYGCAWRLKQGPASFARYCHCYRLRTINTAQNNLFVQRGHCAYKPFTLISLFICTFMTFQNDFSCLSHAVEAVALVEVLCAWRNWIC